MPALMTSKEAMAELRISRNTFWKRIRQGYITPAVVNPMLERQRPLRFRREDIERLKVEGIQQRKAS